VFGRAGVFVLVVAAHVALLWLWSPRVRSPEIASRRVALYIIAPPAAFAAPETKTDKRIVSSSSPRKTIEARPAAASRGEGVAVASPAPSPARPAAVGVAASEPASAPKALDLAVPASDALPSSPRDAALNDPRANTSHLVAGERMAQTLGTDTRLVEDIRPDGSVRVRRGTSCFDARESRATGLDPYNTAVLPKPRQISAC
jgi:hypothetical protein